MLQQFMCLSYKLVMLEMPVINYHHKQHTGGNYRNKYVLSIPKIQRKGSRWSQTVVKYNSRSSRPEMFFWKGVLKNFAKFTTKHLRYTLFLIKPQPWTPVLHIFCRSKTIAIDMEPATTFLWEFFKVNHSFNRQTFLWRFSIKKPTKAVYYFCLDQDVKNEFTFDTFPINIWDVTYHYYLMYRMKV